MPALRTNKTGMNHSTNTNKQEIFYIIFHKAKNAFISSTVLKLCSTLFIFIS